jgi:hypothetical protein
MYFPNALHDGSLEVCHGANRLHQFFSAALFVVWDV